MWIDFFSPQESLLVPAPLLCLGTVQGGWIHLYLVRSTGCAPYDRTAKRYPPSTVLILDFECTDRGILRPRCLYRSERTVLVHLQRLEDVNIPARQTFPGRSALSTMSTVTMRDDGWAIRTSCPSLWRRSRTCVMRSKMDVSTQHGVRVSVDYMAGHALGY